MYRLKDKITLIIVFLAFFNFYHHAQGKNSDTLIVEDLANDLLVYDDEPESYVPFNKDIHNSNNISFYVDDDKYRDSTFYLRIKSSDPFAVFFNNQLYRVADSLIYFSFNSIPFKDDNLKHFINLYSQESSCQYEIDIIRVLPTVKEDTEEKKASLINRLATKSYRNFSIVFLSIFLIVLKRLKKYNGEVIEA